MEAAGADAAINSFSSRLLGHSFSREGNIQGETRGAKANAAWEDPGGLPKSLTWVLPSVSDRHMHYSSVECDQHWSTHTEQDNYIVECRLVCYLASRWIVAVGSQQHSGSAGQESLPAALMGLPTDHLPLCCLCQLLVATASPASHTQVKGD